MIRLLMYWLGRTDYETCKSCQTHKDANEMLRSQLAIANTANRDLHLLLVDIFKPKVELPTNEVNDAKPFVPRLLPSQRRAQMEQMMHNRNKTMASSKHIAVDEKIEEKSKVESPIPMIQPKSIEELEAELAIGGE